MKLMVIALSVLLSFSVPALGGVTTGGGGGGGIANGDSFVLLDLFNEGLESTALLETDQDPAFVRDLVMNGQLSPIDRDVATLVTNKIAHVELVDPYFAAAMVSALKLLSWHFVDAEFVPTKDLQESESITGAPVIPFAIRQGQTIAISKPRWLKMDQRNRVALIVHEVIAALSPASLPADGTRRVVARLFSPKFFSVLESDFQTETLAGFPNRTEVAKLLKPARLRTGLYTRGNFAPLDQRFAFDDDRFPVKVELTSNFYFEPIWFEDRVDRTTLWQRLQGAQTPDAHGMLALTPNASLERMCSTPKTSFQIASVSVSAYELVTWAAPVIDAKIPPRLQWGLREHALGGLNFDTAETGTLAACTTHNRIQLRKLNELSKTLYPVSHAL